jgi:hypothetical protein
MNDGRGSRATVKILRNTKGSSATRFLISPIAAYTAAVPVRTTRTSRNRMRTLERLSASSRRNTAPTPAQGEPSGCMSHSLEIACVHILQAGAAYRQGPQLPASLHNRLGDSAAYVGHCIDAQPVATEGVTCRTPSRADNRLPRVSPVASTSKTYLPPSTSRMRSSTRPLRPMRPLLKSATRSQMLCTRSSRCEERRTVMPPL